MAAPPPHYECLGTLPYPPYGPPNIAEPYTKSQMLEYWQLCDGMVDTAVDGMDLDAEECGFPWYRLPKLDHQINNIRHVQHHAALLAGRLRRRWGRMSSGWVSSKPYLGRNKGKRRFASYRNERRS